MIMRISKSKFVAGCQCVKRLYWQVHEPELAAEPDAATEAIMQQGHEVGMLARQLFPGGVEVRSDGGLDEAIRATRELVANPEVPAIFEGAFENGGVLVRVDVLQRRRDGRWRLIEVKSTTDLKEEHLDDVGDPDPASSPGRGWTWRRSCWRMSTANYVFDGGSLIRRKFFQDQKPHSPSPEVAAQTHFPVAGGSSPSSTCRTLLTSHPVVIAPIPSLRVLRPLQSAAPGRPHWLPAKNPRERRRGAGRNGHRVDPRHP